MRCFTRGRRSLTLAINRTGRAPESPYGTFGFLASETIQSGARPAVVLRWLIVAGAMLCTASVASAQAFATINGSPLRINVGEDMSSQVFNSNIGASGQMYPSTASKLADMGVFIDTVCGLTGPDFPGPNHHSGSATGALGAYGKCIPVSLSTVSGSGTAANPYKVVIIANSLLGPTLKQTVTYDNGDEFFHHSFDITCNSPCTNSNDYRVFLGGDIFLANSDNGIPVKIGNAVGGIVCQGSPYHVVFAPLTPASAYSSRFFGTIWSEIGLGQLSNIVDVPCEDDGAALQWDRTCTAGGQGTSRR